MSWWVPNRIRNSMFFKSSDQYSPLFGSLNVRPHNLFWLLRHHDLILQYLHYSYCHAVPLELLHILWLIPRTLFQDGKEFEKLEILNIQVSISVALWNSLVLVVRCEFSQNVEGSLKQQEFIMTFAVRGCLVVQCDFLSLRAYIDFEPQ